MKIIYFFYILKRTNYAKMHEYCKHVAKIKKRSYLQVILNMLVSFFKYNTAFLDYFYLEFYNKTNAEKATYTDTLFMYKFQKFMNSKEWVKYFYDKKLFYEKFPEFVCHAHFSPEKGSPDSFKDWLNIKKPEHIIVKNSTGQVGSGIEKFKVKFNGNDILLDDKNITDFLEYLKISHLDLIEVCIEQHEVLNNIYAESLNTLRVITAIDNKNNVNILGAILRMGADKCIDNFDAGGISAVVNIKTGIIEGPVIYKSPINNKKYNNHPVNNNKIVDIQLPHWEKVIDLVNRAALHIPQVKTVGWDVALTKDGAYLLEGNHNWDKTHWQKSYGAGRKDELVKYLKNN